MCFACHRCSIFCFLVSLALLAISLEPLTPPEAVMGEADCEDRAVDQSPVVATADQELATQHLLLTECLRYVALAELRKSFGRLWKATWGRSPPAEAFNAWLLAALSAGGAAWLPLPGGGVNGQHADAHAEIMRGAVESWVLLHLPCEWPASSGADASATRHHIVRYAADATAPQAWGGVPADAVNAALQALPPEAPGESAEELRAAARRLLRPLVAKAIAPRLAVFLQEADELTREVRERWIAASAQTLENCSGSESILVVTREAVSAEGHAKCRKGSVLARDCFELRGALPEHLEGCLPRRYEINASHVDKLHRLFAKFGSRGTGLMASFEARSWVLLTRYQALLGPHEGHGWHMALMPPVVDALVADFGVEHELFASPLNCALPSYCSLFEDSDGCFGSCGAFFDFCRGPLTRDGGSFECNPPFEEHLMRRVVHELVEALVACLEPLSIVVVMPDWPDSEALASVAAALQCRAHLHIAGDGHAYLSGRQHCCQPRHRVQRNDQSRGSWMTILQNDAGAARWPTTPVRLQRLRAAWGGL